MTEISKTTVVPYTPEEMYVLVNDIESYPAFLPWCSAAKILTQQEESLTATLSLALGKIKQSFTTENTMQDGSRIEIQLIEGPFKHLSGYWKFNPEDEQSCHIQLHMDFEFKNKIIKHTLGKAFYKVMDSLVESFAQRAQQVYGNR
ncbi:MAG: type II toxin-antitoxin system RatA family toxin [Gammaproteobacteria bacterium]|nr:type II toxin-antitoxin system RatA family toxin [Gammaproteobacteria bacterium]